MMPIAPPPRPKKFPLWVLVVPAACLCLLVVFLGIWQFLAPAERHTLVPYSEFMLEVRAGQVEDIKIRDREITFRTHVGGRSVVKETIGPLPDQAFLTSLRPDDPSLPAPKVIFEK